LSHGRRSAACQGSRDIEDVAAPYDPGWPIHFSTVGACQAWSAQQPPWIAVEHYYVAVLGPHEAFGNGVVEHRAQGLEVATQVQHATGLDVLAQLHQCRCLEQFPPGCPGPRQRDEGVGQLGHAHLALAHGGDDLVHRQPRVKVPARVLPLVDDSHRGAAGLQHRVGQHAHEALARTAVHQSRPRAAISRPSAAAPSE
jgi:hypothetical protein